MKIRAKLVELRYLTYESGDFRFKINADQMSRMHYVEVLRWGRSAGHFDFTIGQKELLVRYGCFATSSEQSFSDWADSAIKEIAIEVGPEIKKEFRGIGSAMVSIALVYARRRGLEGMRIMNSNPATHPFWEKLGFRHEGDDLLFKFGESPIPLIQITRKKNG